MLRICGVNSPHTIGAVFGKPVASAIGSLTHAGLVRRLELDDLIAAAPAEGSTPWSARGLTEPRSVLDRGGRQQAQLARPLDCVRAAVHAELGVHVSQVGPYRVLRHEQFRRDFWPAEVGRQVP